MTYPLPRFASWIRNTEAGEDNPQRDGMFVRVIRRTPAVMNPGLWFELTDGKGRFWQIRPAYAMQIEAPERGLNDD